MATFTITTSQNIDELTGKAGGDVYNINGGTLTIDQHSRFGLNNNNSSATAATSMGSITLSATLGGTCNIDGRYVRMIPFNSGSGTIPALNSLVTQGSASGKLMCVYSSYTAAPLVNGGTMPATGWIMVKQWNQVAYAAGALTLSGVTATATGADFPGFLEIFGDDAATVNANRLGTFNVYGAWFPLGTTNGTSNQTLQIPNNGTLKHIAGVFIEKTAGQGDYEFWPNAGTTTTTGTEAERGKVVWIDNTGLVRIGNSGSATNGYTPASDLAVVVPNVFLQCCLTTARNAEVIPNATIATRYDFTTTGGGVVNIDKANLAWYPSFAQAYSVSMSNSGIIDGVLIQELATALNWSKVGVGNKPTTALLMSGLTMSLCFAGGTFTDCVFNRVSLAASGAYTATITDISGFTFNRCVFRANTIRGNNSTYAIYGTRLVNCTFTSCVLLEGSLNLMTCNGITATDTIYIGAVSGTTVTTYSGYVWELTANTINCTFSGLTLPVTNTHPYTALLSIGAAGCNNIKMRSIGTRASPLNLGSANAAGLIYVLASGAAASDVKIQRVYCSNTRTGIMTGDNSSTRVLNEHVFGDYADAADVSAVLNFTQKALGTTKALTAQTAVYGTHWVDYFTSTTAGRIAILMNEPTTLTLAQVTLANGAAFTSAGGLYMPVIGHQATFETPYYIKGHTSFQNSALVMAGGTVTNHTYNFQIDKNDGNGYSAWNGTDYATAAALGTALSAVTGIDASLGFRLKIRITTSVTNTAAITSVYLLTNSTTTAQDYTYPLDTNTLTFTGLPTGCDIVILSAGTSTILAQQDSNPTTNYSWVFSGAQTVDVGFIKPGYVPQYIRNLSLTAADMSLPISLVPDRNYV